MGDQPGGTGRVQEREPGYGGRDQGPPAARHRVLLVDDNVTALRLLAYLLTARDMEVEATTDALDAVALANRKPFDVMFVDLRMAPIGGLEVLRRTQGLVRRRFVLTGYADTADEAKALSLGATAVLHKPLDVTEMLALIRADE